MQPSWWLLAAGIKDIQGGTQKLKQERNKKINVLFAIFILD